MNAHEALEFFEGYFEDEKKPVFKEALDIIRKELEESCQLPTTAVQAKLPSSVEELIEAVHSDSKRWNELVREYPLWQAVLVSAFEKITNGNFA
jgi:hypothetical protein